MNPFANFGHQLHSLRTRYGWTQQELADRVNRTVYKPGVKQPHIAGLEKSRGEKLPSVPLLAALAEVFGVDMQTLIGAEIGSENESEEDLLAGLSSEDRVLVLAVVSRLRQGADMMDADWHRLSQSVADVGGDDMVRSFENDLGVLLEPVCD
jgi:transcriptional regulator with XRE-family HTH domain